MVGIYTRKQKKTKNFLISLTFFALNTFRHSEGRELASCGANG
jgi:hypothetical protein